MIANIYFGDGVKAIKTFEKNAFDLGIQDPPYFNGPNTRLFYGKKHSGIGVKRQYKKLEEWKIPGTTFFKHNERVCKTHFVFGAQYFKHVFPSGRFCWDKINGSSGFSDFEMAATNAFDHSRMYRFMWNGMCQGDPADGTRMQGNKKLNQKRIHPTEKPIALYKHILKSYGFNGMKVLDCFGGSMSIVLAAIELSLEGFDIEITVYEKDPLCYQDAKKRILQHASQLGIFNNPPILNFHE